MKKYLLVSLRTLLKNSVFVHDLHDLVSFTHMHGTGKLRFWALANEK